MGIVQGRNLHPVIVDQLGVGIVEPTVLERLLVQERARIGRRQGHLDRMRVDLLGEFDRLPDGLRSLARQAEDERPVDDDSKLAAVLGEATGDIDQHALLDVMQDLLVAALVADEQQPTARCRA